MFAFIFRRILTMIPIFLGIVIITFIITRILPGDPALMIAGEQALPQYVDQIREEYGFNDPIYVQLWEYFKQLMTGDLGFAWHTGHSVIDDFISRFPATIELTLFSIILALIVAIPLGILAATFRNSILDYFARFLAFFGNAMPIFWLGLLLILLFYANLNWISAPFGRISENIHSPTHVTGLYFIDSLLSGDMIALKDTFIHLLLPGFCLSLGTMAIVIKMVRASMIEVLEQDFIRTARAKGVREFYIICKHALGNAFIPTLTIIGLQLGYLLGGAVITETIFVWPGLGSYITESIMVNDYAPVQAMTLLSAIVYSVINLIIEVIYGILDPRVRNE